MSQNKALQKLFAHLIQKEDGDSFWHMVELLNEEKRAAEIDWDEPVGKRPLIIACLLAAQNDQKKKKRKDFQARQETLGELIINSGVSLDISSEVIRHCMGTGLYYTAGKIAINEQWVDTTLLDGFVKLMNIPTALKVVEAWKDNPVLKRTSENILDYLRVDAWVQKVVRTSYIEQLREGLSWTAEEASKYMRQRLWPDWQARQYSADGLNLPLDRSLAKDGASMMERIPAQVWEETVFGAPYKKKDAEIFVELGGKIGRGLENLAIPTPELEWMWDYLEDRGCERYEQSDGIVSPVKLGQFEAAMAKRYLAQMNRDGWDWETAGVAMTCMALAYAKHKALGKDFNKDYGSSYIELTDGVKKHLGNTDLPQLKTTSAEVYSWTMSCWVAVVQQSKIQSAGLIAEMDVGNKDKYQVQKKESFHKNMARAYEQRITDGDLTTAYLGVASSFWHHAFRSPGTSLTPALKRILALPKESQEAFWNIEKDDPVIVNIIELATKEMNKKKGDTKNMYANVVLKLTSVVQRGSQEPEPIQQRIKM